MSKAPSPLLGYNNNVRHKNRVFHIQTEDSGIKRPHIITHLFMDGGRILKSVKTSYSEHVGTDKLGDVVRQMMKEQHKAMFRALRDGDFDQVVDDALAGRKSELGSAPTLAVRTPTATIPDEGPATLRDLPDEDKAPPPLTLDLDVLRVEQGVTFKPEGDLPPPPANVLRGGEPGTGGRYRTVEEREERAPASRARGAKSERPPRSERKSERPVTSARSERPAPRSERPQTAHKTRSERPKSVPTPTSVREERGAKRNDPRAEPPSEPKQPVASNSSRPDPHPPSAAARPAAIFGQARPQQSSIFGEDIISDKSLDEVILSYLAEDLEDSK